MLIIMRRRRVLRLLPIVATLIVAAIFAGRLALWRWFWPRVVITNTGTRPMQNVRVAYHAGIVEPGEVALGDIAPGQSRRFVKPTMDLSFDRLLYERDGVALTLIEPAGATPLEHIDLPVDDTDRWAWSSVPRK